MVIYDVFGDVMAWFTMHLRL